MKKNGPVNSSDFLNETIKRRPVNRRRFFRRMFEVAALAVIFGFIACVTMIFVSPILEEKLFPTPTNEVTFTEESIPYTEEEVQPEDMLLEEKPEQVVELVPVPMPVDTKTQLLEMNALLKACAQECNRWLVQVTGVTSETSWLASTSIKSDVLSGAIIADNGTELLILVEQQKLPQADSILVTFADNTTVPASIKGRDIHAELMIVAVAKADIPETTMEEILIAELGSSNNKSLVGNVILAVGSPNGVVGSVNYGYITATGVEVSSWDSNYRLVMTDIYGCNTPNGFLVNMSGQILGVLRNSHNSSDIKNLICAVGISELKRNIENISNQEQIPYLGIKGTDVTLQAHERNGIPYGAYVTGVKLDSPAMQAGIQAGDIITRINEKDISSMYALTYNLYQMKPGETVSLVIMRQSQGEYKESTLKIVLANQ